MTIETWTSLPRVAAATGISAQYLRKLVLKGQDGSFEFQNSKVLARKIHGVGGRSGTTYQVLVSSLPVGLQLCLKDDQQPVERRLRHGSKAQWEREFWDSILRPILAIEAKTKGRGLAIKEAAAREYHTHEGEILKLTERTVRRKLSKLEIGGIRQLARSKRRDAGKKQVIVTREVDSAARAANISDERLEELKANLTRYIRSLIADGVPRKLIDFTVVGELNKQSLAIGIPTQTVPFRVPQNLIQAERIYRKVERYSQDRKAYEDAKPRIMRNRDGLWPMDIVFGDVHPVDILVSREDGSIATARLISFLDTATNRVFSRLVLCEKGMGVRNAHVIQCFLDMVKQWGVPRHLYLDNGTEYNWAPFIDDALKLIDERGNPFLGDISRSSRIIRAKPYNASAKPIEGFFRVLENSYFKVIQGWVGGDRMRQKTANVGKAPIPYNGSFEEFAARIDVMNRLYNALPQRGSLKGLSPDDSYRKAIDSGWKMTAVSDDAFQIAFSEEKVRGVRQGVIQHAGARWTCRELQAFQGDKVVALTPKFEHWNRLPLKNERGEIFAFAERERTYGFLEADGAVEAARRSKVHREGVAELQRNVGKIDIQKEINSNIIRLPIPAVAPANATLTPSDAAQYIISNINEPKHQRREREFYEQSEESSRRSKQLENFMPKANKTS